MSIPPSDQTAFFGPRKLSAYAGVLQVVIIALIHPIGGLLLALDSYHIKYSAQVYLEGLPGLLAVLAVSIFELAIRRKKNSSPAEPVHWMPLIFSAVFLGLAGAGKYIYGMVGPVMLGFLIGRRVRFRQLLLFPLVALAVFILADPFLWPNPPARLWESVMYHWDYSHSQHVVSSGMPWYSPFYHLTHASPTEWHPGVFPTGIVDIIILPLGIIGIPWAIRRRPIWVAWAGFGLLFLIFWPTKWPQYTLLVLPPLCVCAGIGVEQIFRSWFKGWSRS